MNKKELLAFGYDFYNEMTLIGQNEDISYYIKSIRQYKPKNILVVGAGTGRVAIPLSNVSDVEALDIDKDRLNRLCTKKPIITYHMDFCTDYPQKKYDMVIIPYSVLQVIGSYANVRKFLTNSYKILSDNGIMIFDVSENFNIKQNTKDLVVFNSYSKEIDTNVKCILNSKRKSKCMAFDIEYFFEKLHTSVHEKETYMYYNAKLLEKYLKPYFQLIKIDHGYGTKGFERKHLYHCRKNGVKHE